MTQRNKVYNDIYIIDKTHVHMKVTVKTHAVFANNNSNNNNGYS